MNANTKNNKEFLDLATYAFHKPKTRNGQKLLTNYLNQLLMATTKIKNSRQW
ncbi:hypothetical protein QK911_02490 [Lactococcus lactis]